MTPESSGSNMSEKMTMKQVLQAHNAGAVLTNSTISLKLLRAGLDMSDPRAIDLLDALEQFHAGQKRLDTMINRLNAEHGIE